MLSRRDAARRPHRQPGRRTRSRPACRTPAFAARGLDWAYVPLAGRGRRLEDAVAGLVALGFAGANVTIPHKTAVARVLRRARPGGGAGGLREHARRSRRARARLEHGRPRGRRAWSTPRVPRVLVLGAGGAAQAVATALADAGAAVVTIAARTAERAQALAARLRTLVPGVGVDAEDEWPPPAEGRPPRQRDADSRRAVVELAGPAGRRPRLPRRRPADRARRGRAGGGLRAVVDGLEVLVAQGAASFERWTGVPAPSRSCAPPSGSLRQARDQLR